MSIQGIDHVALTVADVAVTCAFYQRVLGADILYLPEFLNGKIPIAIIALGGCRLSIHPVHAPAEPHALRPTPGSADLCFLWSDTVDAASERLRRTGVEVEVGPVPRPAHDGSPAQSVYFRDPDNNLIELLTTIA